MSYIAEKRSLPQAGVTDDAIDPSDDDDLDAAIVGVNVGTAGFVRVQYEDGTYGTIYAPQGSSSIYGVATRIMATGTDADDIRGIRK